MPSSATPPDLQARTEGRQRRRRIQISAAAAGVVVAAIAAIPSFVDLFRDAPTTPQPVGAPMSTEQVAPPSPPSPSPSPSSPTSETSTNTSEPPPTGPVVRHAGEVTLTDAGMRIDLNSPASAKNWGAVPASGYETDWLTYYGRIGFEAPSTGWTILDVPATYTACRDATTYSDQWGDVGAGTIPERARMCLLLASGRYGTLSMVRHNERQATVKITIWETP